MSDDHEASGVHDAKIIDRSIVLAESLLDTARNKQNGRSLRHQRRMRRLLAEKTGTTLVFSLVDRVLRPVSAKAAARQLRAITAANLTALPRIDQTLLRIGGLVGRVTPRLVVALASTRIRVATKLFIAPFEMRLLTRRLRRLQRAERRANLNVLGEMVLGWDEAIHRRAQIERLLRRADVDCVSVKMSAIAPGLSLIDFDGSLARALEPLRSLYRSATANGRQKLVNLDMEEHRELDLTVALFISVLSEPEFVGLTAGIAIQAYLPDSHQALDRLLEWANRRQTTRGAPIRIRLVKGANLAMERVEAEQRSWPTPTYSTKAETDASYKCLLERLLAAAATGAIRVGVASHNLFDLSYALTLSEELGAAIEIEMLAGMADDQADAVASVAGNLLQYLPVTSRSEFHNAMAYLARRLDENATPDGFLRHALDFTTESAAWREQSAHFAESVSARSHISTVPRETQDRAAGTPEITDNTTFFNEPDTDLTVPANRVWANAALDTPARPAPSAATIAEVESAVARSTRALQQWQIVPGPERRELLFAVADRLADARQEAIATMIHEAGKTFAEADPEVSEAIDYARRYAHGIELIDSLASSVDSSPLGVVVVAPPWNFPFAIPASGVLAALAAGNTVILKPSPEARATAAVLIEQLHLAGFDPDCVQLVPTDDDEAGRRLITHPEVGGVILTGSWETATTFARWAPGKRILAETNGKNALIVTANADVDLAVHDLVRSAFSHAGQKCSAASLAIVDASLYDHSPFLRQLADATKSLRIGAGDRPASEIGPIVGPMTPALVRALTRLDHGEQWLVEPHELEDRLWSPGVRIGVQPGSWAHHTEWFGPVLGVMRAKSLDDAVRYQNGVAYGLTAGLHSLDPDEQRRWIDSVEAGNLYINRHITGAIVGRQPFGGWKRSRFGPTAKAGGPNYLLSLRRWWDRHPTSATEAAANYARSMREEFSKVVELTGLQSESNELRYRNMPTGITVRISAEVAHDDVHKAAVAAALSRTPMRLSSPCPRPDLASDLTVTVESAATFARTLRDESVTQLRLLGSPEEEVIVAAAEAGVTVLDEPMCSKGRLELARWLQEQSICRILHRYGNVVYPRFDYGSVSRTKPS